MKKIVLIIPCYNEEDSLLAFHKEVTRVFLELTYEYEILFIKLYSKITKSKVL